MITVFKTGEFDYSDAGIDKPVRYSIENLIEIASRTSKVPITKEHTDEVIDEMSNFIVKDGLLQAEEPNLELKGMGFSPVLQYDLIDMGDYYVPKNILMSKIGYTENPRTQIVYNSIEVENNEMDDKQLRDALDTNKKLNEDIGVYKSQIKQLKKANKEKDNKIEEIKNKYSDVDDKLKEYDSLKEIETKYNGLISSKKDDLIHQLVGDDTDKARVLEDWSVEQLEFQVDLMSGQKQSRGITPQHKPVDDGNHPDNTGNDENEYTDEMFEADFEASGL